MTQTAPLAPSALAAGRRLVADADACDDPIATARLLPRAAYVDPDVFAFEKEAIFGREWLCIAHTSEVPEPGDTLALQVMDEPVLVVRDAGGQVNVLSGICQHRGHPIFDGLGALPDDSPCFKAKRFTCPYHSWVFGLDGRLLAAPEMQATVPVEQLRRTVALPSIRTEVFHGLVFVCFDDDAPSLAPTLARLDEELATFGLDELVAMPASTRTGLRWNWKLHHDNALEPYHTSFVHKGVHEAAPAANARFYDFTPGEGAVMHPTYLTSEDVSLATTSGERLTAPIPGLTDDQRRRVMFASVPPLLFAILQPTLVSLSFVLPVGPDEMALRRVDLYPKAAVEEEGFEEAYALQRERKKVAIMQDQETLLALQRGYRSRYAPRGPLSHLEAVIPQMNSWLLDRYRAAVAAADAGPEVAVEVPRAR
ncbi:aromatic ring-hydroxylating dioxygenase subunit alpha [Iamia sp. SCSIO 61187]|uniref:aromatic ring-hydroxylating oxygenase subunit alpha n=1 Tax=Iamia sp. SCSIO 61187 TaxID=2722752 RepID=UPI001C6306FE|nr:aromatic ring-hydroxylating dioxygenase subunit alpha [Iamia sp. SCSIO 61187]QYG94037.1 aromatic ring-hydroxylating dioxygenase subunit alpha [Iamia sp. SCSIO 61187]